MAHHWNYRILATPARTSVKSRLNVLPKIFINKYNLRHELGFLDASFLDVVSFSFLIVYLYPLNTTPEYTQLTQQIQRESSLSNTSPLL